MSIQRPLFCIDIGGTDVKFGHVHADARIVGAGKIATEAAAGGEALFARLADLVHRHAGEARGIAVSTFGAISPAGAITGLADAVPGYSGMALGERLAAVSGLPVTVENDVNCVALAEYGHGAAQGYRQFIALTLGTGIGGAIMLDGELLRGGRFAAGEWGYMTVDGQRWEDVASTRALVAAARQATGEAAIDGRAIFAHLADGDQRIVAVVERWSLLLATGIANLIYVLDPDLIVLGGGVTEQGAVLLERISAALDQVLHVDLRGQPVLRTAAAGNHAGLLGAALHWSSLHIHAEMARG